MKILKLAEKAIDPARNGVAVVKHGKAFRHMPERCREKMLKSWSEESGVFGHETTIDDIDTRAPRSERRKKAWGVSEAPARRIS